MSLTREEQEELRRLEAFIAEEEETRRGEQAVEQARPRPLQQAPQRRRFSFTRTLTNILRNSAQGVIDTIFDVNERSVTPSALDSVLPFQQATKWAWRAATSIAADHHDIPREEGMRIMRRNMQLPRPRGSDETGLTENIVTGIGEFLVPYIGWRRAFGVAAAQGTVGRIFRETGAAAAVDFTQWDPAGNNMANILRDGFGLSSEVLDALAAEEDDDALEVRFKAAAAGAPLGIAAEVLFALGGRGMRAYRDWRTSRDQADGIIDSIRSDYSVNTTPPPGAAAEAAEETAEGAAKAPRKRVRRGRQAQTATADVDQKSVEARATQGAPFDDDLRTMTDNADTALSPEAARLIDEFVGHGPMSRNKTGAEATGRMSPQLLEEAVANNDPLIRELMKAFAPVRAALRQRFGNKVRLYRVQEEVTTDPNVIYASRAADGRRRVLSWTTDKAFARAYAGVRDVPQPFTEAEIARFEAELADNGEVVIGNSTLRREVEDGAEVINIYDRQGELVTDTASAREFAELENEFRSEAVAREAAKSAKIIEADVDIEDILWATDRAGQSEVLVRNDPSRKVFIDETGTLKLNDPSTISTPNEVLAYLRRVTGDGVPDDVFNTIAARLLDSDRPGNLLGELGIHAAAMDFSILDNPLLLRAFQEELAEIIGKAAKRLGRTGTRVTTREIQTAARVLATTDEELRGLHGRTDGLAESLMAARIIVAGHANNLMKVAEDALAEIKAGAPGEAWSRFAQSFDRHAYYQAAVRGASSEVGRALRSLQMSTPATRRQAAKRVSEAVEQEAAAKAITPDQLREDADHWVRSLKTDAEKIEAISQVLQRKGDVGELTRFVRVKSMSKLKRVDMAIRETTGNLFSDSTFWLNTAAGASMLGIRSASKLLAALARAPIGLVSQRSADIARRHLLDAIVYTDGMVRGFGEAFHNVVGLFEREVGAEAVLHANALGLDKLAKRAALMSARGAQKIANANYRRDDVVQARFLAMTPAEERRLGQIIRNTNGPEFMQRALRGLVSTMGSTAVNSFGTLSRSGTLLFVNSADELIGSIAARAGSQSEALRIAAAEAADLDLHGRDLWAYLKARSHQLSSGTSGWGDDAYEKGRREAMVAAGTREAQEILFQDPLEFAWTRNLQRLHQNTPGANLVIAFFKTPMRILERTAIDFTPLGLLKDRIRKAILAGGPEADEAMARMGLGLVAAATAFMLAEDRIFVGHDGGYRSSARVARPSYSVKVGDDFYELHRVDPFGTIMGWGADLAAVLDEVDDDITRESIFGEVFPAMAWATAANILEKSWLTDMKSLTELAGATSDEEFDVRWRQFIGNYANRIVPGAGIQRSVIRAEEPWVKEADNFITRAYQTTLGAEAMLPVRRDQLGRPVLRTTLERMTGVPGGPQSVDPVDQELEALSFAWPKPRRTLWGVRLNPHQYSRLLELRGQIVRDPQTGLNMEETVRALIEHEEWDTLAPAAKIDEIKRAVEPFTELAHEALLAEDREFARGVLRDEVNTEGELEGWSRNEREAVYEQFARQLGL